MSTGSHSHRADAPLKTLMVASEFFFGNDRALKKSSHKHKMCTQMLLLISGIEPNPGPPRKTKEKGSVSALTTAELHRRLQRLPEGSAAHLRFSVGDEDFSEQAKFVGREGQWTFNFVRPCGKVLSFNVNNPTLNNKPLLITDVKAATIREPSLSGFRTKSASPSPRNPSRAPNVAQNVQPRPAVAAPQPVIPTSASQFYAPPPVPAASRAQSESDNVVPALVMPLPPNAVAPLPLPSYAGPAPPPPTPAAVVPVVTFAPAVHLPRMPTPLAPPRMMLAPLFAQPPALCVGWKL